MKFTPTAECTTRACPGPGSGTGTSTYCRTSGPPNRSNRIALATLSPRPWNFRPALGIYTSDEQPLRDRWRRPGRLASRADAAATRLRRDPHADRRRAASAVSTPAVVEEV